MALPYRVTILASGAQTATASHTTISGLGSFTQAIITLNITAVSGTTPSLTVKLQTSDDGGTTWYDLPSATFTAATAVSTQIIQLSAPFGDTLRAVSTITGTTPSFTEAIKGVFK